jgi:putative transposase
MNWVTLQWVLMRQHLLDADDTILAAGDHVVVTKAGKKTYGLDRLFSSLHGKAVPGLCVLSFSLISVTRRTSYPALTEHVAKAPRAPKPPHKQSPRPHGRPKGRKNRHRREVDFSPSLRCIQAQLARVLWQSGAHLKGKSFLFDGELGHHDAVQMVRQLGLHVVSKLRYNAALYFPYEGPYAGRGLRRKDGKKLEYRYRPAKHVPATSIAEGIKTDIDQMSMWHKTVADLLNIVVIAKTRLKTHKTAHVVLCSSDVTLGYALLIDYDRLRFQRECNFRDAKQYWRLEDFMSVKERPVYNSANLAMFMVNVSQVLIRWCYRFALHRFNLQAKFVPINT